MHLERAVMLLKRALNLVQSGDSDISGALATLVRYSGISTLEKHRE